MEHLKADREENHVSFTKSATQELRQSSLQLKATDIVTEDLMALTNELKGTKCQQNALSAKVAQNKLSSY